MGNIGLADEVIRRNHRLGQILLQVHLVQEIMAAAVGKAAALADHVENTIK
jgi:hypothetical protein